MDLCEFQIAAFLSAKHSSCDLDLDVVQSLRLKSVDFVSRVGLHTVRLLHLVHGFRALVECQLSKREGHLVTETGRSTDTNKKVLNKDLVFAVGEELVVLGQFGCEA